MKTSRVKFDNSDGNQLAAELEFPVTGRPRAWALFAHCFTCTKNLRAAKDLSNALSLAGFLRPGSGCDTTPGTSDDPCGEARVALPLDWPADAGVSGTCPAAGVSSLGAFAVSGVPRAPLTFSARSLAAAPPSLTWRPVASGGAGGSIVA